MNVDSCVIYRGRSSLCFFVLSGNISDTTMSGMVSGGEKAGKNGLFLEVFGTFDPLPNALFNPNFKGR